MIITLQVLKEVLIKIQDQNDTNVDTRNGSPEETSIYILSVLRVLNYQPQVDPATFRQEPFHLFKKEEFILI